jgi:predicted extracellular nuclease
MTLAAIVVLSLGCAPSGEVLSEPQVAADGGGAIVISGPLSEIDWNAHVGKRVSIEGELVIVDTYDLMRWGEVKVARDRLSIPTNHIDPNDADPRENSIAGGSNVAAVTAAQKQNDRGVLILDDGFRDQNTFPPRLFPELGGSLPTIRTGSVIEGVSGELQQRSKNVVLVPSAPLTWTPADRPARPVLGEAGLTVACFNVLNYFTTVADGTSDARGASTQAELQRQQAKLVAAMVAMQADVIGVMELENSAAAEEPLVAALNQAVGAEVFRACGVPARFRSAPGGSDAIRVGLIYRSDRVVPVGGVSVVSDRAFGLARAPLVQTFTAGVSSKPFTVVVNHLKSKGGSDDADRENKDRGDGQGAYTAARRAQALALCAFVEEREQADEDARILLIGDFNAYAQEDPIDALRAAGLVDLRERFGGTGQGGEQDYSYVYFGQSGTLDYAFGTEAMAADVTGVATWHINADEPRALDYNQEYNPEVLYRPDAFRSSDHDPVLIGIAE